MLIRNLRELSNYYREESRSAFTVRNELNCKQYKSEARIRLETTKKERKHEEK